MQDLKIKRVKKKDLKTLSEIYVRAFNKATPEEKWTDKSAYAFLENILKKSDLCFTARLNEKIVGGFFTEIKPWWAGNFLNNGELFVDTNCQKKGIGLKLIKFGLDVAVKKYNITHVFLETFRKGHQMNWYKKFGFYEVDYIVPMEAEVKTILEKLKRS
jgi:predicted N-acetyltransferase YhbS